VHSPLQWFQPDDNVYTINFEWTCFDRESAIAPNQTTNNRQNAMGTIRKTSLNFSSLRIFFFFAFIVAAIWWWYLSFLIDDDYDASDENYCHISFTISICSSAVEVETWPIKLPLACRLHLETCSNKFKRPLSMRLPVLLLRK